MHVIEFESEYRDDTVALLIELQDFERVLSSDRVPGHSMAADHFNYLLRYCEAHEGKVFLALEGSEVAGFVVVFLEAEDEEDLQLFAEYKRYGWISDLIVKQRLRGSQAATMLVERAEQHCASVGVRRVKLATLHNNERAKRFYENSGYSQYELIYSKGI